MANPTVEDLIRMGAKPAASPTVDELVRSGAQPRREVDGLTALAEGFGQGGTFGFGDEIGAGVATMIRPPVRLGKAFQPDPSDTPEVAALKRKALEQEAAAPTYYENVRDAARRELGDAEDQHPVLYKGGQVAGAVAADYVGGKALKGLGIAKAAAPGVKVALGKQLLGAAKRGAVEGAAFGLGTSKADDAAGEAIDATIGAGLGSAAGPAGLMIGKGLAAGANALSLPKLLRSAGVAQFRRHLLNGADALRGNKAISDEAVGIALDSPAAKPFATTAETAARLGDLTEAQAARYSEILETLEAQGVRGPKAQSIADELIRRGQALQPNTLTETLPAEYGNRATQIVGKLSPGESTLGLRQAEKLKQSMQAEAKYGKLEETELNKVKRDVASVLRQAIEDAVEAAGNAAPDGSPVRSAAQSFVPVKRQLGSLIEATDAAERGAAASAKRSSGMMPGPLDMIGAVATGQPGLLVMKPATGLLKTRGTSTLAITLDRAGKSIADHGAVSPDLVQALQRALASPSSVRPILPLPEAVLTEDEKKRRRGALAHALLSPP